MKYLLGIRVHPAGIVVLGFFVYAFYSLATKGAWLGLSAAVLLFLLLVVLPLVLAARDSRRKQ